MTFAPPIPRALWDQIPPAAQAALTAVLRDNQQRIDALERHVRELEERLGQDSTNSNRPPSSDGPAVTRRGKRTAPRVAVAAISSARRSRWRRHC
jgi:transposase